MRDGPINRDASADSPCLSMYEALERCDTPVNTKLQLLLNSPHHPAKNQPETCSSKQNCYYHINEKIEENIIGGRCENDTNICRYYISPYVQPK